MKINFKFAFVIQVCFVLLLIAIPLVVLSLKRNMMAVLKPASDSELKLLGSNLRVVAVAQPEELPIE